MLRMLYVLVADLTYRLGIESPSLLKSEFIKALMEIVFPFPAGPEQPLKSISSSKLDNAKAYKGLKPRKIDLPWKMTPLFHGTPRFL